MLTKKQWEAKVYGYAYKEEAYNYKIDATGHFPKESFEQWLGLDGKRGDGSIYKPQFVDAFVRFIKRNTDFNNVHVVVADGVRFIKIYISRINYYLFNCQFYQNVFYFLICRVK